MSDLWEKLKNSGKAYIIAEAGVNHLGSLVLGERLIKEAKAAGADAIKFQSYKAENLTTKDAPRFWDWEGEVKKSGSQYDSYAILDSFGYEEHKELKKLCDKYNIDFLSTPFDNDAADYLETLGMIAYKIASCDLTNHPFIKHIAQKGKLVFLATGASTIEEIHEAVAVIESTGNKEIVIMHCTLCYPTREKDANLNAITHLQKEFPQYVMGLSDHTMNLLTSTVARALGAIAIEKHYTVDKTLDKSADHWLSIDPGELKALIQQVRTCETLLGAKEKHVAECEVRARNYARRSIVLAKRMKKGSALQESSLLFKRPGTGIPPKMINQVIGKKIKLDLDKDTVLGWEMLED
jgi:sialic acid synthase SpsE